MTSGLSGAFCVQFQCSPLDGAADWEQEASREELEARRAIRGHPICVRLMNKLLDRERITGQREIITLNVRRGNISGQ